MRDVSYDDKNRHHNLEGKTRVVLQHCSGAEICAKRRKAKSKEEEVGICNSCYVQGMQPTKVEIIDILADQKTGYEKALEEEKTRREQAEGEVQRLLALLQDKKEEEVNAPKPIQNRLGSRISLTKAQVVDIWDLHYKEGWSVNKIHKKRHIATRTVKRVVRLEGGLYTVEWVLEALQKGWKSVEVKQRLGVDIDTRLSEVRSEIESNNKRNNSGSIM